MQVALADRILLTKTDMVAEEQTAHISASLSEINRHAPEVVVTPETVIASAFWPEALDLPHSRLETASINCPAVEPVPIATASLTFDGKLPEDVLEEWLSRTVDLLGPLLLRMKAMLDVENATGPIALHVVRGLLHRPVEMNAWPGTGRTNRIVLIGQDVEQQILVDALARLAALARAANPDAVTRLGEAAPLVTQRAMTPSVLR
jgi:G3E family GTPase